jgi:transposase, IS5 family
MRGQPGFFDVDERYAKLSEAGDPLERLVSVVDFEVFRHQLRSALNRSDRGKGGRPPYDPVLMFKVLVLQALYNLSDDQAEFQIRDRLSFMRFLGLGFSDAVPDAKTIWLFRELLVRAEAMEKLFSRFEDTLRDRGYFAMGGQIVDATIVEAPRQHNTDTEKADLKAGKIPDAWKDKPAKLAQKDRDARWTLKRGRKAMVRPDGAKVAELVVPSFGYKNHVGADQRFGFVRRYLVTHAAANDGRPLPELLYPANLSSKVWADTAYRSKKNEQYMDRHGFVSKVHFRKPMGKPMPEAHRRANVARSKVRSAIEHVFATEKHRFGMFVRTIGIKRAAMKIGMVNLVYNFSRLVWLEGKPAPA